jgi:hypothetical protein
MYLLDHFNNILSFLHFRINNANPTVAARDRLTIFFHAVLSKDFKLEKGDQIFIRVGNHIGIWKEDLVEVFKAK